MKEIAVPRMRLLASPPSFLVKYAIALCVLIVELAGYALVSKLAGGWSAQLVTPLDVMIPFVPWTTWLALPGLVLALHVGVAAIRTWEVFLRGVASLLVATAITYPIFLFLPATFPRPELAEDGSLTTCLLELLRVVDPAATTFPALPAVVLLSVAFAALRDGGVRGGIASAVAAAPIVAFVTTKEHAIADLVGAALVALAAHAAVFDSLPWEGRLAPTSFRRHE
jgi:hypothetical protein